MEKAEKLAFIPEKKLFFVCNANDPSVSPAAETKKQLAFLETFGRYCLLSFNIYTPDFDLAFLVDYIKHYKLRKLIRLGITHPILGEDNKYIDAADLQRVGKNIIRHFELLQENEIRLNVDCGFPLCMFDDESLGKLYKLSNGPMRFSCGAAIDIGTNLDVWPCFPLSGYEKKSLYDFSTYPELLEYYGKMMKNIRADRKGIYPQCDACPHMKRDLCAGGCGSYILRKIELGR
jgi:radical SAM protein with 4Fe4S-binding SPASM domain